MENNYQKIEPEIEKKIQEIEQEIEKESKKYPIHIADFLKEVFRGTEWIVEHLIPKDSIIAISGLPGSYKTWIALIIAKCVAQGESLFGYFKTTPTSVLIVDEENSKRLLHKRLSKLKLNPYLPIYLLIQTGFKIDKREDFKYLLGIIEKLKIGLIIFDSLIRIHNKDENDAKQMALVFEKLKKLTQNGASVVFTHHHRKQSAFIRTDISQSLRGSSDILAAVDCHVAIDKQEEYLVITQTKLREEEELRPFKIGVTAEEDGISIDYLGEYEEVKKKKEEAKEAIIEFLKEVKEAPRQEIIKTINEKVRIGGRTLGDALKELRESNAIILKDKTGKGGAHIYVLPEEDNKVA